MNFRRSAKQTRNKRLPAAKTVNKPAKSFVPAALKSLDWGRVRVWGVGVFFTILWFALWGRAYQLQIIRGDELQALAKRQQTARETIVGLRGSIMDRNGNVLARSVDTSSVWLNPNLVKDKQMTSAVLGKILEVPPDRVALRLKEKRRFVWLVRKVNDTVAKQIKAAALPGVYLAPEFDRIYPYKTLAGQLLGFVDVDDKGIEGLEKAYENRLGGMRVKQEVMRDASGRKLGATGGDNADLRGRDVRLTIDTQVQFFAEESLAEYVEKYGAKWGGCIVVDVPTGEVLAWAQYPFFDPNTPGAFPEHIRRNRLATDALEQGSTIKSFLIASALEEKVVTPDTSIYCEKGRWKIGRETIHDTHSYGTLPVSRILHVSSNIGVAKIAFSLGAKKYHSYLTRLGFGQPTNLPLAGEAKGILRRAERWQEIDTATAAFGQGFSATLVQMAKAYLCLASNGEAKELKLALDDEIERRGTGPEQVSQPPRGKIYTAETMRKVRSMLREVVEEDGGTGKNARIPGIVVGGKTGTAQKVDRSGRYGSGRVGSFVGMVPIDNPRYLVCVLLDEPVKNQYGGVNAAPVFRDVALRTMAYHGHLPDSDDPIVKAIAEKEAARRAKAGEKQVAVSRERQVTRVSPSREAKAEAEKVRLARKRATQVPASSSVPPVVGLGIKRAVEVFAAQGVMPAFKGKGAFVVRQDPPPGSPWPTNKSTCVLWLEDVGS